MNFSAVFANLVALAAEMTDLNETGEKKLADLTARAVELLELTDDTAISLLPPGWQMVARLLVDNPMVDEWERSLAASIAEAAYQAWKAMVALLGPEEARAALATRG